MDKENLRIALAEIYEYMDSTYLFKSQLELLSDIKERIEEELQ